jgi:hypothetical protein
LADLLRPQLTDIKADGASQSLTAVNGDVNGVSPGTSSAKERLVPDISVQHMASLDTRRDLRDHHQPASATPPVKRPSLPPENSEDLMAHQRLQAVHAPVVEELKHETKAIQKVCAKQDKELIRIQMKYQQNIKRLEMVHVKEREKVALEQDKARTLEEKRRSKLSTAMLTAHQPYDTMGDLDGLVRGQEDQWWQLLKRQADATAAVRREYYRKELEVNLQFHESFYQMLEAEIGLQLLVLNERLRSVNKINIDEIKTKLSLQASKELAELKFLKDLDKSQLEQRRDDVTLQKIRQGVSIAKKYEILYEDRRKVLTEVRFFMNICPITASTLPLKRIIDKGRRIYQVFKYASNVFEFFAEIQIFIWQPGKFFVHSQYASFSLAGD